MYINCMMPFGTPSDTSMANVKAIKRTGFPPNLPVPLSVDIKRPAWKPYLHKGKQRLEFLIREELKASQYDSEAIPNVWQVHGTIFCKAEIEGLPEITVSLSIPTGAGPGGKSTGRVESFLVDSRVHPNDLDDKKLCFSPPLGQYPLCTYIVTSLPKPPLRGFYQMKEVDAAGMEVKILAQLKLNEDFCQLMSFALGIPKGPNRKSERLTYSWERNIGRSETNPHLGDRPTICFTKFGSRPPRIHCV